MDVYLVKTSKFENLKNIYNHIFYEMADPRTRDLPMLGNPIYWAIISGAYLYFIYEAGPRFMKGRQPFNLRNVIQAQNIFKVLINAYIFYELMTTAWLENYNLLCTPMCYSRTPNSMRIIKVLYIMFWTRIMKYLDTIISILRRRDDQVTTVHVLHHVGLTFIGFIAMNYGPLGQSVFSPTFNSIVHIFYFGYYTISYMGPPFKNILPSKKYLLILQLVEFVVLFTHATYSMLDLSCDYPRWILMFFLPYLTILFILTLKRYHLLHVVKKIE